MAPKYPFARAVPSGQPDDRPVVVSASGSEPTLAAPSPNLRSRSSPRGAPGGFAKAAYPSASGALAKVRSKLVSGPRGRDDRLEWVPLTEDRAGTPTATPAGTPSKGKERADNAVGLGVSPAVGRLRSTSSVTVGSVASSVGAEVSAESSRFLSPDRPVGPSRGLRVDTGGAHDGAGAGATSYSLASPSYSPSAFPSSSTSSTAYFSSPHTPYSPYAPTAYDDLAGPPGRTGARVGDGAGSIYHHSVHDSTTSFAASTTSMTHLRAHDALALGTSYANLSITSKGGKRRIDDMFSLPADPAAWSGLGVEEDDDMHDPDIKHRGQTGFFGAMLTVRGAGNVGCLVLIFLILVLLFAGYPIISEYMTTPTSTLGAYNLGGINASGQLPDVGPFELIDKDTPTSAYTYTSMETGETWELVFSDEFNNAGRTFYDGDDPYWEAVDLHYWQTNNLEWYDPKSLVTEDGHLTITLTNETTHGLNYRGGMMSTWNRFCFTGGYIEASVSLPGTSNVYGLWPAVWTMGNLGRAGYGGSLDGLWPYTYDSCDVGTVANQSIDGVPAVALTDGDPSYDNALSYLPGQRLSRCTCPDDTTHPGPVLANGTFVGRAAPEIDMFEATVDSTELMGFVSQSGQWAPFNPHYYFLNSSNDEYEVYNDNATSINTYLGGVYQQATSALTLTDQDCYTGGTGCFSTYGFEYAPGGDGYITWIANGAKAWTVRGAAMAANAEAAVGQRVVSEEPMYIIVNLGLSENFGAIDYTGLASQWPVEMHIDYIRVYQDPNNKNIGCDPADRPTAAYIASMPDAYSDPNITVFDQIPNAVKPKNSLVDTC
ncbi:hypothetical protein Q5752_003903 [Cryptotrichosporon argae]